MLLICFVTCNKALYIFKAKNLHLIILKTHRFVPKDPRHRELVLPHSKRWPTTTNTSFLELTARLKRPRKICFKVHPWGGFYFGTRFLGHDFFGTRFFWDTLFLGHDFWDTIFGTRFLGHALFLNKHFTSGVPPASYHCCVAQYDDGCTKLWLCCKTRKKQTT